MGEGLVHAFADGSGQRNRENTMLGGPARDLARDLAVGALPVEAAFSRDNEVRLTEQAFEVEILHDDVETRVQGGSGKGDEACTKATGCPGTLSGSDVDAGLGADHGRPTVQRGIQIVDLGRGSALLRAEDPGHALGAQQHVAPVHGGVDLHRFQTRI